MSTLFPSHCIKRRRKNITKYKLPLTHRYISRKHYLRETVYKAWEYHLAVHNLQVPDITFRKIIYDAVYDALPNRFAKNHYQDFLTEYTKFNEYFYQYFPSEAEKIADWEAYRQSEDYQKFLERVRDIRRLDHRLDITVNNAFAYMYAKYQKGFKIAETYEEIERALRLDIIEKAWSKKWLWTVAMITVFDPINLYAQTHGQDKYIVRDIDWEHQEAIKIYITPWWERKDIDMLEPMRKMSWIYDNIVATVVGELASPVVAEIARRVTVTSLVHITKALLTVSTYHPTLRYLTYGAELVGSLAQILNRSVLSFLGWQIAVEWPADGFIQHFMQEALKFVYTSATGINVWDLTNGKGTNFYDFESVLKLLIKQYTHRFDNNEYEIIRAYKRTCPDKAREILTRIEKALQTRAHFNAMISRHKFEKRSREEMIDWRAETYFSEPTESNLYKFAEELNNFVKWKSDLLDLIGLQTVAWNIDMGNTTFGYQKFTPLWKQYQEEKAWFWDYIFDMFERGERDIWVQHEKFYCLEYEKKPWGYDCVSWVSWFFEAKRDPDEPPGLLYREVVDVKDKILDFIYLKDSEIGWTIWIDTHNWDEENLVLQLLGTIHQSYWNAWSALTWLDNTIKLRGQDGDVIRIPVAGVLARGIPQELALQIRNKCMSVRNAKYLLKKYALYDAEKIVVGNAWKNMQYGWRHRYYLVLNNYGYPLVDQGENHYIYEGFHIRKEREGVYTVRATFSKDGVSRSTEKTIDFTSWFRHLFKKGKRSKIVCFY